MKKTQETVENILEVVREDPSYLNIWSAYKKIESLNLGIPEDKEELVCLAVIGSSTLEPLAACIDIKTRLEGFTTDTFVGGFNTYRQEVLDENSNLYKTKPDVIILSIDALSVLDKMFLASFVRMSDIDRNEVQKEVVESLASIAETLQSNTSALILLNNFIVPTFSPLGIVDNRQSLGLKRFFKDVNMMLENRFLKSERIFVVDIDSIASHFGKSRIINWNTWYRGSIPFSDDFTLVLTDEYLRYIRALKGKTKKCIILDLDNTLWGGIIGEDGIEGIKLGPTAPGVEYVDFQKGLLSLHNRGVILAICSKNNYDDAIKVFKAHPYQVLKEEHFAAIRINWQNKVANIAELAKEINLGLESMVFIDDNPVERALVSQAYPEVYVVDMPKNPRLYRSMLEEMKLFDVLSVTKEDMNRGEMYVGKRKRVELEKRTTSLEEFLGTLELKVQVQEVTDFNTPRVVQLIRKTNQFNLTTRRYTDAEVQSFRKSKDSAVYSMAITDRFGDEGVVGVAIVREKEKDWIIDSFLMSCRVIGRNVETALLAKIVADGKKAGAYRAIGEFIPTKKNPPAADFYERHGFEKSDNNNGVTIWILNIQEETIEVPEWIELIGE